MRNIIKSLALAGGSFLLLCGFGEHHSKIETKSSSSANGIELKFRVVPDADMQISKDGPWTLQLTHVEGLKLETKEGKFETKTFDEALPGFLIKTETDPKISSGKIDYSIKAFVCSLDKKHCYPQAHKGSLDWTKN